jgi:hypothetical protein
MKVDLINLGDSPRVFYDARQQPVVLGIGRVVCADMGEKALQAIAKFKDTETVLVAPQGEGSIPEELQKVVDLLSVIEFEEYNTLLIRMRDIIPITEATDMRPNRQQIRSALRAKIDEYIAAQREVHDDVDPKVLQKELEESLPAPATRQAPAKPRPQRSR